VLLCVAVCVAVLDDRNRSMRALCDSHDLRDSCIGMRRCIRCLKLQVSFHKRATNYTALLRNTTLKDKASYGSSIPPADAVHDSLCDSSYHMYVDRSRSVCALA